jgi:hypothetical protein
MDFFPTVTQLIRLGHCLASAPPPPIDAGPSTVIPSGTSREISLFPPQIVFNLKSIYSNLPGDLSIFPLEKMFKESGMNVASRLASRLCPGALVICGLSIFSVSMRGQINGNLAAGVPEDWSHHRLLFSNPGTEDDAIRKGTHDHWLKITNDPRYQYQQWKQRQRPAPAKAPLDKDWSMNLGTTTALLPNTYPAKFTFDTTSSGSCSDFVVYPTGVAGATTSAAIIAFDNMYGHTTCSGSATNGAPTVYWAYNTGGTSILSPSISNDSTGSQIAYIQTTGTTASLVLLKWAAGPAGGAITANISNRSTTLTVPGGTLTAADAGAQITGTGIPTGDTIASVTNSTTGVLAAAATGNHTGVSLTIEAETATTPGVPVSKTPATYRACTAPCYTAIAFGDADNDTNSSPFVDLVDDTIYVGDNSGYLHKFTGVFNGNPTEVISATAPIWPVPVGANILTSPVYDSGTSDNIFVADSGGFLYAIKASTAVASWTSSKLTASGNTTGIVDSPIVDSTTEEVYVFVGDDSNTSSGAACDGAGGCAGIFQFGASEYSTNGNATSCVGASGNGSWSSGTNCGVESALGTAISGNLAMYDGTFDHIYFTGTGTTGHIWSCPEHVPASGFEGPRLAYTSLSGTGTIVSSGVISAATNAITTLASANTTTAICSPVSEVWGSDAGTDDYIFLSVSNTGAALGTSCTGACLYNFVVATGGTATTPGTLSTPSAATDGIAAANGTTGIIIDNTSNTNGESEIYYTTMATQSCANSGTATTGNCAVQTSQTAP